MRRLEQGRHVIFYRIGDEGIVIGRILHQRWCRIAITLKKLVDRCFGDTGDRLKRATHHERLSGQCPFTNTNVLPAINILRRSRSFPMLKLLSARTVGASWSG